MKLKTLGNRQSDPLSIFGKNGGLRVILNFKFLFPQFLINFAAIMKNSIVKILVFSVLALLMTSCKNEFERVRTSGDVNLLLQKSLQYYDAGEFQKAQTLFELIMPSIKGRPELETVSFKYANTHFALRNYTQANFYFKRKCHRAYFPPRIFCGFYR